MGIYKTKDRKGRLRYVVSRRWPARVGRIRKYVPTRASAKALLLRIEQAIASGTWRDLMSELEGNAVLEVPTVRQFSKQFVDQYGKTRMKTWIGTSFPSRT